MTGQDILDDVVEKYYEYKRNSPHIEDDEMLPKKVVERLEYQAFLSAWTTGRSLMWTEHLATAYANQAEIRKQIDKNNASVWTKLKSWWNDKF